MPRLYRTKQKRGDLTEKEYTAFAEAFRYYNRRLFDGTLPDCLFTLQRKHGARGYFSSEVFEARPDEADGARADEAEAGGMALNPATDRGRTTDEIALNPVHFKERTDEEILSTLVHEMVHLWQHHFGHPGRTRYHNRQWADRMEELGLMPSDTGEPGGKRTGPRVTHYILDGGPFEKAARELLAGGFRLNWQSRRCDCDKPKHPASKVKYTCPGCQQNAWAKPDASLVCGLCDVAMPSEEGR
jgi:hypothetical protein